MSKTARDKFKEQHPERASEYHRRRKFGLSPVQHRQMVTAQQGRCALCGGEEPGFRNGKRKSLAVDHDHVTGVIRSLLCSKCNTALGLLNHDIALISKAIAYLKQ